MLNKILKINNSDNVITALSDLKKGEEVQWNGNLFLIKDNIAAKHKFFEKDMQAAEEIIMYGVLVGKTQVAVNAGSLMTTENVKHAAQPYAYRKINYQWYVPDVSKFQHKTFNGYKRSDGKVGTANYWLFIPTVFCENRNLDVIKEAMHNALGYAVTDKYKFFTNDLVDAFKAGDNLDAVKLNPANAANIGKKDYLKILMA